VTRAQARVVMQGSSVAINSHIRLLHVSGPVLHASQVLLSCEEKGPLHPSVVSHITQSLVGKYVAVNTELSVKLLSQSYNLVVTSIDSVQPSRIVEPPPSCDLQAVATELPSVFFISDHTHCAIDKKQQEQVTRPPLGGLDKEFTSVREMVELALTNPDFFTRHGLRPPRGVLLFGPPGTGKTSLVAAVAAVCAAKLIVLSGPEIVSKFVGESESKLRRVFAVATIYTAHLYHMHRSLIRNKIHHSDQRRMLE